METRASKYRENWHVYTRKANGITDVDNSESSYEKFVIVPKEGDKDPSKHAWADARFATDIMAEHALFFALLMPEELAKKQRKEALDFNKKFTDIFKKIDSEGVPEHGDLNSFVKKVLEEMKPFIEYKATLGDAQRSGDFRSLVWPLFFDHTRHEAERWTRRLEALAGGHSEYNRSEVVSFWTNIMDEHARFVAHLLDPDEFDLIDKAMETSKSFAEMSRSPVASGASTTSRREPGMTSGSMSASPEMDSVMSAAQSILDFKTEAARGIEAGKIKSIIEPRLADHVRREAQKFVDELKRT
jgi:hypothetical protein